MVFGAVICCLFAALLFGLVGGMAINVLTSVIGAWISLLVVRSVCRPCIERRLGRFHVDDAAAVAGAMMKKVENEAKEEKEASLPFGVGVPEPRTSRAESGT